MGDRGLPMPANCTSSRCNYPSSHKAGELGHILNSTCTQITTRVEQLTGLEGENWIPDFQLAVAVIALLMAISAPIIFLQQRRKGKIWFFKLNRRARGSYIMPHPLNVFVIIEGFVACLIFILIVLERADYKSAYNKMGILTGLNFAAWTGAILGAWYATMGTLLAVPDNTPWAPGLHKMARWFRPLGNPWFLNTLVVLSPLICSSLILPFTALSIVHLNESLMPLNALMKALSQVSGDSLPDDHTKMLLVGFWRANQQRQENIAIAYGVWAGITFLVVTTLALSSYNLLFLLRRQVQDQQRRVRLLDTIQVHTSTEIVISPPSEVLHQGQQQQFSGEHRLAMLQQPILRHDQGSSKGRGDVENLEPPCKGDSEDGSQKETTPPCSPASLAQLLHPVETDGEKDAAVATTTEQDRIVRPRPKVHRISSCRDSAALTRLVHIRRCFWTLAAFYTTLITGGTVLITIALLLAVELSGDRYDRRAAARLPAIGMCAFEFGVALGGMWTFVLIGIRIFDQGALQTSSSAVAARVAAGQVDGREGVGRGTNATTSSAQRSPIQASPIDALQQEHRDPESLKREAPWESRTMASSERV